MSWRCRHRLTGATQRYLSLGLFRTASCCFEQSTATPMWLAVYRQGIDVPTKISAARSSATISKPWACLRMTMHC